MPTKKPHNWVGRCIYCDSTDGLTREHVMPIGLGGNHPVNGTHYALVLGGASCERCRKITKEIETQCLNTMLGHFRGQIGLVKRSRQKIPMQVRHKDGTSRTERLNPDTLPTGMLLPHFGRAGIRTGAAKDADFDYTLLQFSEEGEFYTSDAQLPPTQGMPVVVSLEPAVFGQMLAKIALGSAVDAYGLDAFQPLVRDFILREPKQAGYWINGSEPHKDVSSLVHSLASGTTEIDGKTYVVVKVTLFAKYKGPANTVIVGLLR